jgi:hypothetical protein
MRDLKRVNTKLPAYKYLGDRHIEVFTPMQWTLKVRNGIRVRENRPFMHDLLFVHDAREVIDPIVDKTPTLQYRYIKGRYRDPMTVDDTEMDSFIRAVNASDNPKFYMPDEITPDLYGRKIRIVGGPLDGCEGRLMTLRGSKVKRLLVDLPNLFHVSVEVNPEFIEFL